jgi:arylsulfatase A-like enzyme
MGSRLLLLLAVLWASLMGPLAGPAAAGKFPFKPAKRLPRTCEMPYVFYSSAHKVEQTPCCATVIGLCAGGAVCPGSGVCPDGRACLPATPPAFTNVLLMIADDLGECHFGHAGECRSAQSGTPIPAPATPNLDLLAGYGTVFPIAHNTAPWCFPSLVSIVTGRYQRSFNGERRPGTAFGTIPSTLRSLDDNPFTLPDPYNAGNKIGGYCTLRAGKLSRGSVGEDGFDVAAGTSERVLGRVSCAAGAPGQPPPCGSDLLPKYAPGEIFKMGDVFKFLDSLLYRVPGTNPAEFRTQPFFVWYAPRIPHQPLRAPQPIRDYLFGAGATYPLGGIFDLGSLCSGSVCPPTVTAFQENNFGNVHEMYSNVWWMDQSMREIRRFLATQSEPHCVGPDGKSLHGLTPQTCPGTWAATITPNLAENTVLIMLADNGWHLPHSKHQFTENAYRTRLIVFDPKALPSVPGWDATQEVTPPAQESNALAHAVDVYATAVGYALGTPGSQLCPMAPDGSRCDGKDLRPYLLSAPGGPAPSASLRRALCGHDTQRPTSPTDFRYLLTREGSVGRCTNLAAPSCNDDGDCSGGAVCVGGHCAPGSEPACSTTAQCPAGAVCFGSKCRAGPSCIEDADCANLFPGQSYACVEKDTRWCRNDPSVRCSSDDDCPACPDGGACARLCEPRRLKFYFAPGGGDKAAELADLFLDPDEVGLHEAKIGSTKLLHQISNLNGPYGSAMRRANCCVDDWFPGPASSGTICSGGCPADLTCND